MSRHLFLLGFVTGLALPWALRAVLFWWVKRRMAREAARAVART